jgi:hypothetical protein
MQRLRKDTEQGSPAPYREYSAVSRETTFDPASDLDLGRSLAPLGNVHEDFSVTSMSYHLDDFGISVPETVEQYEIPPREIADQLFDAYLFSVHPSFPIIGKTTFTSQYQLFFDKPSKRPGNKWLAILNMIFAIAAKYSHLIQATWKREERDHLVYFTRARKLGMNGEALFSHPDLQQVQVEGLVAFYLLASGQINRYGCFTPKYTLSSL